MGTEEPATKHKRCDGNFLAFVFVLCPRENDDGQEVMQPQQRKRRSTRQANRTNRVFSIQSNHRGQ